MSNISHRKLQCGADEYGIGETVYVKFTQNTGESSYPLPYMEYAAMAVAGIGDVRNALKERFGLCTDY